MPTGQGYPPITAIETDESSATPWKSSSFWAYGVSIQEIVGAEPLPNGRGMSVCKDGGVLATGGAKFVAFLPAFT